MLQALVRRVPQVLPVLVVALQDLPALRELQGLVVVLLAQAE